MVSLKLNIRTSNISSSLMPLQGLFDVSLSRATNDPIRGNLTMLKLILLAGHLRTSQTRTLVLSQTAVVSIHSTNRTPTQTKTLVRACQPHQPLETLLLQLENSPRRN